ncbi:MAG TPA: cyanophycinase, partial [Thermoanaerobaculia bacterium]|nr:cyanophycinase [Thermoanaerobaculia bacterium]
MTTGSTPANGPGLVMAIGGAEDKVREKIVLRRFVAEAGGADASIVVLATASEHPETGERYADLFYGLDAGRVE